MKTKDPVHIMEFGKVINEGNVMSPFIFLNGLRVNTDTYFKWLDEIVQPLNKTMAAGRLYIW